MKKLLFALAILITCTAATSQRNLYKLKKAVPAFGASYSYIKWNFVNYPETYNVYWCIPRDTVMNTCATDGTIAIPDSIIAKWTTDDNVIPAYIETKTPWAN